jgi:hypothetical protein
MTLDFIAYMKAIAETLKSIAHSDTASEKRFFRVSSLMNMDEMMESLSYAGSPCIAVEDNFSGRITDGVGQNLENSRTYSFMVLEKCDYMNAADRESAIKNCFAIVLKVMSKIKRDYHNDLQGGMVKTGLRNFDWSSPFYQTVGPVGDGFCGIMMQFVILAPANADMKYNTNDWAE